MPSIHLEATLPARPSPWQGPAAPSASALPRRRRQGIGMLVSIGIALGFDVSSTARVSLTHIVTTSDMLTLTLTTPTLMTSQNIRTLPLFRNPKECPP